LPTQWYSEPTPQSVMAMLNPNGDTEGPNAIA
jgi:hypothetical protein